MCQCTPTIRTPFCGKPGCEWPAQIQNVGRPKLGLDLSTKTGWARGWHGARVEHGVWKLGHMKDGVGECYSRLASAIEHEIEAHGIEEIIYESPLPPDGQDKSDVAELLYGLCAIVEMVAHEQGLPTPKRVTPNGARLRVMGTARPGKTRKEIKENVKAWCRARGFDVFDDNDADAIVLLTFRQLQDDPLMLLRERQIA